MTIYFEPLSVRCVHCRAWFDRPLDLPAHLPATTCTSPACRAKQRAHEQELREATIQLELVAALPVQRSIAEPRWRKVEVIADSRLT